MKREFLLEMGVITGATAIVGAAVFFFLMPSHLSIGSVSGLAIVLHQYVPFSVSTITMVINVFLILLGFLFIGKEFSGKTVYTSILLPTVLAVLERIFPNISSMTGDQTLDAVCYVLVASLGMALLFNRNASSGGLDIVAKLLNKYLHIDIGKAVFLAGICAALSSALVYDKKTVILSLIGTYLNGVVVDYFVFGSNAKKRVCIISNKEEEIRRHLIHHIHGGATIYNIQGAYDLQPRREIIAIVDKHEYTQLIRYVEQVDPDAFITVCPINELIFKPKTKTVSRNQDSPAPQNGKE